MPRESAVFAQQTSFDNKMGDSQAWHMINDIEDDSDDFGVRSIDGEAKSTFSPSASIETGDKEGHDDDTESKLSHQNRHGRSRSVTSVLSSPSSFSPGQNDVSIPTTPESSGVRMPYSDDDISLPGGAEINPSFGSLPALLSDVGEGPQHGHVSFINEQPSTTAEPRLVMPSLSLPSRRPFSSRGRSMGRLKLLIAGTHGAGKTSLLESIVALNQDIVHVDQSNHATPRGALSNHHCTSCGCRCDHVPPRRSSHPFILEVHASTKPYPWWWSKLKHPRVSRLQRRSHRQTMQQVPSDESSINDSTAHGYDQPLALERNICFVDTTPGCDAMSIQTQRILSYIRDQHSRSMVTLRRGRHQASKRGNHDLEGLLSGDGGTQVDVVLYLIAHDTLDMDIACMRKLASATNVVPLIAKADTLTDKEIEIIKRKYHAKATAAGLETFTLQPDGDGITKEDASFEYPYAVSAIVRNNIANETTNSSGENHHSTSSVKEELSELSQLVNQLFDAENMRWARLSAARKLLLSTNFKSDGFGTTNALALVPSYPLRPFSPIEQDSSNSGVKLPNEHGLHGSLTEHERQHEGQGGFHVAEWATSPQPFLDNDDDYVLTWLQGDCNQWLTENHLNGEDFGVMPDMTTTTTGDHMANGLIRSFSPISETTNHDPLIHDAYQNHNLPANYFPYQDPLGLLAWRDRLQWLTSLIIQGMVGLASAGLIFWLIRVDYRNSMSHDPRPTTRNARAAILDIGSRSLRVFASHFCDIVSFDA